MSFDIHGNSLRRGHCEVHPHVAEEYPCFVCIGDKRKGSIDREREAAHHKLRVALCQLDRFYVVLAESFPLLDDNGLDADIHHCEWAIQQERKRLHALISTFRTQGGDI